MDEVIVSRAIAETYFKELLDYTEMDVAVVGAGPSGLTAAYYLARHNVKTAIFERKLSIGGGMWGGAMMFNKIVVQPEGKEILDEFGVNTAVYQENYHVADAVEAVTTLCSRAVKAGAKVFNCISVEDVMIREQGRVTGLVLNWTAVDIAGLHVDPLVARAKMVIDATGHASEVSHVVARKAGGKLEIQGEKSMWAEMGEKMIIDNTREVYPGLIVTGMAANAVMGSPRMGAIFGGMLLSGKRAAELAIELINK
jgi:thiazole biosynthesis enzyme